MRRLPLLFYTMGTLALFLALYFWLTAGSGGSDVHSDENWALFVAKWAPTLIGYGIAISLYQLRGDLDDMRRGDGR